MVRRRAGAEGFRAAPGLFRTVGVGEQSRVAQHGIALALLAVAAASVLLTACKDENDDGNTSKTTYEFSVKAEDNPIDAPADGKTYTILVTST